MSLFPHLQNEALVPHSDLSLLCKDLSDRGLKMLDKTLATQLFTYINKQTGSCKDNICLLVILPAQQESSLCTDRVLVTRGKQAVREEFRFFFYVHLLPKFHAFLLDKHFQPLVLLLEKHRGVWVCEKLWMLPSSILVSKHNEISAMLIVLGKTKTLQKILRNNWHPFGYYLWQQRCFVCACNVCLCIPFFHIAI